MVTGQRPFHSDSNFSIMQAHLQEPPKLPTEVNPDLPVGISEIIMMAMEKDPAKRFQSADAFANALRTVAGSPGAAEVLQLVVSLAAPVPAPEPARRSGPTTPLTPARVESSSASSQARQAGAPQMPPQPASGTGHRGLYITLGALIVLMVLVAAGFSAPRWFKARANNEASRPAVSIPAAPEAVKSEQVAPAAPSVESLAPAPAASTPARKAGGDANKRPSQSEVPQQRTSDAQQAAQPDTAQLDELDRELDQLSSREMAITASLDALSREQNAQGMHLRGDMVEAQARMRTYLGKAQSAIQVQDARSARKYLDLVEPEVERLEKFLGR